MGASLLAAFDVASQVPMGFAAPRTQVPSPRVRQQLTPLLLKVRRLPQVVEVVIEGAGGTAEIAGVVMGPEWVGRLVPARPSQLAQGDQAVSLPDGGYQSISLLTVEGGFQVRVRPLDSRPAVSPVVRGDGTSLILSFPATGQVQSQNASYDLSRPGRLPQPELAPALRPRAVAPPLGDMAVGTMILRNPSYVNVSGPPVTLTTRGANAQDLLMVLAQMGGYNFAFSSADASAGSGTGSSGSAAGAGDMRIPVTVSFNNEPFGRAFNFVLLAAGLQARLKGRTVLVGRNVLSKTLDAQMSKVFRLNQVSPDGAADYLANLGATINKTNTVTITANEGTSTGTGGGAAVGGSTTSQTTSESTTQTVIESYGARTGPLVGLQGVTDSRLGTITLVGDPATIAIAESYLRQLDLRKRQVAIKIEIINVDLNNNVSIENSFAYRPSSQFAIVGRAGNIDLLYGNQEGFNPENLQVGQFTDWLQASIRSSSAKALASPTLLIQEGGKAEVEAVKSVITDVSQTTTDGGVITCSQTRKDAGLKVPIEVKKIDDNGFVTLTMKPEVSVPEPAGTGRCGGEVPIFNIVKRALDSGTVRLRDGQTLVITGVIQDDQRAIATKVPLLGDIPIIGQFFRASSNSRQKSELIIMATPYIAKDDDSLSTTGYGSVNQNYSAP